LKRPHQIMISVGDKMIIAHKNGKVEVGEAVKQ
jgi:hypothetical protein